MATRPNHSPVVLPSQTIKQFVSRLGTTLSSRMDIPFDRSTSLNTCAGLARGFPSRPSILVLGTRWQSDRSVSLRREPAYHTLTIPLPAGRHLISISELTDSDLLTHSTADNHSRLHKPGRRPRFVKRAHVTSRHPGLDDSPITAALSTMPSSRPTPPTADRYRDGGLFQRFLAQEATDG